VTTVKSRLSKPEISGQETKFEFGRTDIQFIQKISPHQENDIKAISGP